MFTDEKIFTKNGYFNSKNDVVWADDRSDTTERDGLYSKEKYPISIAVALGTTCYGLITSPYSFQKGQDLNGRTYHDKLLPFYQKEVSDTKLGGSNRMELTVILIKSLSNGVRRTLFRRTDGHLTHLN